MNATLPEEQIPLSPPDQRRLLRVFGVAFGVAVAIGNTIGAGILRTPGEIARELPSPFLIMTIWVAGGVYALLGAVSLAEPGAMIPRSGGQTVFVRRAIGPYAGFAVGWSDWISTCASTAFVSIVIGEYSASVFPALESWQTQIAVGVAIGFAMLHAGGAKLAGSTQLVTSAAKAIGFLLLIAACFALGGDSSPEPATAVVRSGTLLAGTVLALQSVIYTYDGWTGPIYFSEEVKDPGRDIPRAMIGGVLAITAIYLLTNAAFLYVLPVSSMAGQPLVAATAAGAIFGDRGDLIIRLLVILSMLGAINALTLMAPRVLYAIGESGLFPPASKVDVRGTPTTGLLLSTIVVVLFTATGTVNSVGAIAAIFFVANYALSFLSVFLLRIKEPDTPRPYRAWGYPFSTGLVFLGSIAFLVAVAVGDSRNAFYAIALLALSYPVFLWLAKRTKQ
jgi:APA family basic amino acid/polyamine antiporter